MDLLKNSWFSEIGVLWPGQCFSLKIQEILYSGKSKYQDILILQTSNFGRALILDGAIQATERDEFMYQEMMANLPIFSHQNPENVLVIGGGDGGIVRELAKHNLVKNITLCEIDQDVIDISKKFLPSMACGFDNPKVNVHVGDGFEFMKNHTREYDVIITDSSDPIGPAESLFKKEYYELVKSALKDDGILCSQGESIWLHMDLIKSMRDFCKQLFPVVKYASIPVPSYPSGQIGCLLCGVNKENNFLKPCRKLSSSDINKLNLRAYNSEFHEACFKLPQFAQLINDE